MIANLLCACASFSWVMETTIISIFLFGEYPYPVENQDN